MPLYNQPIQGMPIDGPSPSQPSPAAYHQAMKQTMPEIDEVDRLRMEFGIAPQATRQYLDPFWQALANTLQEQHVAAEDLQEQAHLSNEGSSGPKPQAPMSDATGLNAPGTGMPPDQSTPPQQGTI